MKLKRLQIKGLFNLFDYDISFENEEGVTIITGPNGYGKTTILKIIDAVYKENSEFFKEITFGSITLFLGEHYRIEVEFVEEAGGFMFSAYSNDVLLGGFNEFNPLTQLNDYGGWDGLDLFEFATSLFISDKRLHKNLNGGDFSILSLSDDLKKRIELALEKYAQQNQILESSYVRRLTEEKGKLTQEEFYTKAKEYQAKIYLLSRYGLYEGSLENLVYHAEDAKALSLYFKDLDAKLSVFEGLLNRLQLFVRILSEKQLTNKSLQISESKELYFLTTKGVALSLDKLSSGEQQQVILLYELIFKATPNTLVLVDEPETSLHVSWQRDFIEDLLKIIELQGFQAIVVTHSISIIRGRRDLQEDLFDLANVGEAVNV